MMDAVLIGEGSGLERLWTEQYRATGTFHALIISGSHVAVLAGAFLFLLRICFIPRGPATLLTVAAAWLYALVTGWQAPVVRSAAGMTLFAIGSLFYREKRLLNLLAAVALFFLVARSRPALRCQLPALVSRCRVPRLVRRAPHRTHLSEPLCPC